MSDSKTNPPAPGRQNRTAILAWLSGTACLRLREAYNLRPSEVERYGSMVKLTIPGRAGSRVVTVPDPHGIMRAWLANLPRGGHDGFLLPRKPIDAAGWDSRRDEGILALARHGYRTSELGAILGYNALTLHRVVCRLLARRAHVPTFKVTVAEVLACLSKAGLRQGEARWLPVAEVEADERGLVRLQIGVKNSRVVFLHDPELVMRTWLKTRPADGYVLPEGTRFPQDWEQRRHQLIRDHWNAGAPEVFLRLHYGYTPEGLRRILGALA